MRDGAVIFVWCITLVGSVVWIVSHQNGIHPFTPAAVTTEAREKAPKEEPRVHPSRRKSASIKRGTSITADTRLEIPHIEVSPDVPKIEPTAPPQMPSSSILQIRLGLEKASVRQMYGDPNLRTITGTNDHTFDTFVYTQVRGDEVVIIHFVDGIVFSAQAIP